MKSVFSALILFGFSFNATAQSSACGVDVVRATYLKQTMAQVNQVYLCEQSGPVAGNKIDSDLTTCLFVGVSGLTDNGATAVSVISKNGLASLSDSFKLGNIYGIHINKMSDESVTVSEQILKVTSAKDRPIQTEIALNMQTGAAVMKSRTPEAGLNVAIPLNCHLLP